MIAIQIFNSAPMLDGRGIAGTYSSRGIDFPKYFLDFMKLSARQCCETISPPKLYTDSPMRRYLEKQDMLHCWDEIDTDVLDNFNAHSRINQKVFWSAGKFACYNILQTPFVCIDVDLIPWHKLEFDPDAALVFSHWESVEADDVSYPPIEKMNAPNGYRFRKKEYFGPLAANMSISYFANEKFKNEFVSDSFSFMEGATEINIDGRYATPEILFIEQRNPLAIANEKGLIAKPVVETVWSPLQFRFIQNDPRYGEYFFPDLDTSKPFTHLWFHKKHLDQNVSARQKYSKKLQELLNKTH